MEDFWRSAPSPALRLWPGGAARWEANEAAMAWAEAQGVQRPDQAAHWHALALQVQAAPGRGRWSFGPHALPVDGRVVDAAEQGALLWWDGGAASVQRVLQTIGVSAWEVDFQSRWVRFEPLSAPPVGIERAFEGMTLDELRARLHPDDREAVVRAAADASASERVVDVIARYRMLDGSWRPVMTRRVARRNAHGAVTGLYGVSMEVDAMVREQEQLRQHRERMAASADAAGLGLWHRSGTFGAAGTEWNDAMYRLYGRSREQGTFGPQEWFGQIVHPLDVERMRADQARCDRDWVPTFHTEFRVRTPDGSPRWIYSWTRRELRNGQRVAFGVHFDVTERRLAAQQIESERERALFALNAAGVGVWQRGLDLSQPVWNEAMYRLRGLDPSDRRSIVELTRATMHPDDQAMMDELVKVYVAQGQAFEKEYRVVWPDGSVHWLATRGRRVQDEAGKVYMVGINVDVTERRRAEALRLEGERLEQARRAQSEFLARVSHELRTPMNAVLGFGHLLAFDEEEPLTPRQRTRLEHIEGAGRHLLGLIDDVLELASVDAQQTLALEPVRLDAVAREALGMVQGQAQRAGIALRLATPALEGVVQADRRRLGQVAINLLTNAIKYNRPGGWVEVGVRTRGGEAGQLALAVTDSGRGLSAEQCRRLFEPFDRLGAENEGIEGTGIGLSIVRQLAERMGGTVEVDSTPGVGSEFRVWLPTPRGAAQALRPDTGGEAGDARATPGRAGQAQLKVLCIEDNETNLQLVRELIGLRPGVRLACAETGRQGVAEALRDPPDLVLLDMQLPDLHGTEVLQQLQAQPALAGCRMVALSANAMPADVAEALAAGFDDYWTKPIDVLGFLAGIDKLLAQAAAPAAQEHR